MTAEYRLPTKGNIFTSTIIYDSRCWHSLHFTEITEIISNGWWWGGGTSHRPQKAPQCSGMAHLVPFTPSLPMEQPAEKQAPFSHNDDLTIQGEVESISFHQRLESLNILGIFRP